MTQITRLLLWLLSTRPDVDIAVTYLECTKSDLDDSVDYLEWCYGLDPTLHHYRSIHGEDKEIF